MSFKTQRLIRNVEIRSFSLPNTATGSVPDLLVFYEGYADRPEALQAWQQKGRRPVNIQWVKVFRVHGWAFVCVTYDDIEIDAETGAAATVSTYDETVICPTYLSDSGGVELAALADHYIGCVPYGTDIPHFLATGNRFDVDAAFNVEDN